MLLWLEWLPDMSGGATSFEDVGGFRLSEERPGALLPYPPPKKSGHPISITEGLYVSFQKIFDF